MALVAMMSVSFVSCKEKAEEAAGEATEAVEDAAGEAAEAVEEAVEGNN